MQTTTPETDAFTTSFISIDDPEGNKRWVPSEFARVLERERDEAREELDNIRLNLGEDAEGYTLLHAVAALQNERDDALSQIAQAECRAERFCQERDEAIKRYEEISRVFEGANEEEWKPCTTLGETVARILKERDEARNKMADALQEVDLRTLDFERMKQELHAARAEAAKWEAIAFWEASANSPTKKEKELKQHRQADRELHSTDPMWQKPLSTSNPIPYTTSP